MVALGRLHIQDRDAETPMFKNSMARAIGDGVIVLCRFPILCKNNGSQLVAMASFWPEKHANILRPFLLMG